MLKELWLKRWVLIANTLLVVYSVATTLRDAFPDEIQKRYQLNIFLHHWSWQTWIAIFACGNFLVVLHGAYLAIKRREKERDGLAAKLNEIENTKPRIVLSYPKCEYVENVAFKFGDLVQGVAPIVKIRFINKPSTPSPLGIAKGIRAKISFFSAKDLLLQIDGRWSKSDQPSVKDPRLSRTDLLTVDFGIEEEQDLDIAFREPGGDFIAWNNDNYDYGDFRKPEHRLPAAKIDAKVLLVGPYVREEFRLSFEKTDSSQGILLTKQIDFTKRHSETSL